jgi:hypothetical protein
VLKIFDNHFVRWWRNSIICSAYKLRAASEVNPEMRGWGYAWYVKRECCGLRSLADAMVKGKRRGWSIVKGHNAVPSSTSCSGYRRHKESDEG